MRPSPKNTKVEQTIKKGERMYWFEYIKDEAKVVEILSDNLFTISGEDRTKNIQCKLVQRVEKGLFGWSRKGQPLLVPEKHLVKIYE